MTFPSYATGTVSVSNGAVIVTGTDTLWQRSRAREGDVIYIDPDNGYPGIQIESIDAAGQLTLAVKWTHGTKADVAYKIVKGSIDRVVGTRAFADIEAVVGALNADGFEIVVTPTEDAPDPGDGNDGQYAWQPTTGKRWVKVNGLWTYLGTFSPLQIRGAWSAIVTYEVNNVATRNGKAYYAKRESLNAPPESSPSDWGILVDNGDLYPVAIEAVDRPASGETWRHTLSIPVTFRAGLGDSAATAAVAATASTVFSIRRNGVQFATMTFAASGTVASFVCATDTSFVKGDVLSVVAPTRDASLADLAMTLVAYR